MNTRTDQLEKTVLGYLDDAMGMRLGLTEDDSDYDLSFICTKLALCSTYLERLSDIQLKLSKITIEVTRTAAETQSLYRLKEVEVKASDSYRNQSRDQKTSWLMAKLKGERETADQWSTIKKVVSEIKDAVGERALMMKRLDSDIRLHSKLYDARVAAGATSPNSYTGSNTDEIDLD